MKGLLQANSSVKNAMLFNVLSFFSDKLLTEGNTVATLDELYIWLSNLTAVEYIRNSLKRVRKKESALILASQNLEDFDQPGIRELTRPLFAIPTHQFLFNAGSVDKRFYMDNLQLEPSEFELIDIPSGVSASTSAAMSGICWRSTPHPTRKNCLERREDGNRQQIPAIRKRPMPGVASALSI